MNSTEAESFAHRLEVLQVVGDYRQLVRQGCRRDPHVVLTHLVAEGLLGLTVALGATRSVLAITIELGSHRRLCAPTRGDARLASLKGLDGGLLECRLHFGPGYRIYLGRDGHALVILLAGGTKAHQQQDIDKARELWREYRRRKREEVRRGAHP